MGLLVSSLSAAALLDPVGWRGLVALGALPILLLLWIRVIPESPRWLAAHGHLDAARNAIGHWVKRTQLLCPSPDCYLTTGRGAGVLVNDDCSLAAAIRLEFREGSIPFAG